MTFWRLIATSLLTLCVFGRAFAQDLGKTLSSLQNRLNEDPLRISGSFTASSQYYQAFQINNRALPFSGRLMAALNFDLLGFNMPLSLAYSSGGLVFGKRLPSFSFIGISPSYKWAKILLGNRSMDFGKYSFSRHSFNGIGLELSPSYWRFSAFYGRLRRARAQDLQGLSNIDPYFRRWALGSKVAYENGRDKIALSLFKAWDDENSIPKVDSVLNFTAAENLILSTQVNKGISNGLDLEVNYAYSGFTANRSLEKLSKGAKLSNFIGLLNTNVSTRFNNAFEAKLKYKYKRMLFDIAYERIDPGYRTMGALFFNNDLANLSAGLKFKFLKGRLNVAGRSGMQRNNLQDKEANDYERLVGSMNINFLANKKLTFTAQFSNFNIANRRLTILDPASPIAVTKLVVNNRQASFNANYIITNTSSRTSTILVTSNFAQGNTVLNDDVQEDQGTTFYNLFAIYSIELKPIGWSLNVSSSYSKNVISSSRINFSNIGFSSKKNLFDNRLSLGILGNLALNQSFLDQSDDVRGRLLNLGFNLSTSISPNSVLTFNSAFLRNRLLDAPLASQTKTFSEFRNTLNFQYRFNPKRK